MRSARLVAVATIVFGTFVYSACGDDTPAAPAGGYGGGTGPGGTTDANVDGGGSADAGPPEGEVLYRALEPQLIKSCGGTSGGCHVNASMFSMAPTFLAGPDSYVSIKKYPGIVTADVFQSIILTKGQHEGPSITVDAMFEHQVEAWLSEEALELQQVQLCSTAPFAVTLNQDNDVDLSSCATGVTGVHLKFKAGVVGNTLSLTNMRIAAPAGQAVHIKHPLFYEIPADPSQREQSDPEDSFSNADQTVPGGVETSLAPGTAIFTGWGTWNATNKMRIAVYKIDKGTLVEASTPVTCKDSNAFGTNVAPILMGNGSSAQLTCTDGNCHGSGGDGQGAMDLSALTLDTPDFDQACTIVLKEIDKTTPANSKIVQKPAGNLSHVGGKVDDPTSYTNDWTGFIQGGTIF